jgi:hypothetical protein
MKKNKKNKNFDVISSCILYFKGIEIGTGSGYYF